MPRVCLPQDNHVDAPPRYRASDRVDVDQMLRQTVGIDRFPDQTDNSGQPWIRPERNGGAVIPQNGGVNFPCAVPETRLKPTKQPERPVFANSALQVNPTEV